MTNDEKIMYNKQIIEHIEFVFEHNGYVNSSGVGCSCEMCGVIRAGIKEILGINPAERCTMDPNSCKVGFCSFPNCTEPSLR